MKNNGNIAAQVTRFACATCILLFVASWLTAPANAQQTFSLGGQTKDSTTGAPIPDATVTLSGTLSRTAQTDGAGMFSFTGLTAGGNYDVTPSKAGYVFTPSSVGFMNLSGNFTTTFNGVLTSGGSVQFSAPNFPVGEGTTDAIITVTRGGDTSAAASVDFVTVDDPADVGCADQINNHGAAYARCDYATTVDTIRFAPGESSKTIAIPLIDDVYVEANETVQMRLSNPVGAVLGSQTTATLTILDNDAGGAANPIFNSGFFVRMQYLDFLSREPDQSGFNAWTGVLNGCPNPNNTNPPPDPSAGCDRIQVSSSFFGSQEFQLKGFFVFRFYKVAFNRLPTYVEIVPDMRAVTGQTSQEVFQKKAAFAAAFTQRAEFAAAYGGLSNAQYVATLLGRYNLTQITTPNPASPDDASSKVTLTQQQLVDGLNAGTLTRAQVLRAVADSDQVGAAELNSAFVLMQYVGYLRRTPETAGYNAWFNYLNTHPGDFRTMVNGFMNSTEYRLRFGSATQ